MEIQKILFPQIGRCTEEELYFRMDSKFRESQEKVRTQFLYEKQRIDFEKQGKIA